MEEGEVNILALFDFFRQQKLTILAGILVCTLAAVLVAFLMKPVYRAELTLSFVGEDRYNVSGAGGTSALAGVAAAFNLGGNRAGASSIQVAMGKIKAPTFYIKFLRDEGFLPLLFPGRWDQSGQRWIAERGGEPTDWEVSSRFAGHFNLSLDSRSGLIRFWVDWDDPEIAFEMAEKFISRANDSLRAEAIARAELRMQYLEDTLARTNITEIRNAISGIMRMELEGAMLATIGPEYAFETVSPAIRPDPGAFVRPNRPLLIVMGLFFGTLLGIIAAYLRGLSQWSRTQRPQEPS